ncbi:SulP family inorganic anion transporter [Kitasatospora cineracea]|uniref:SulP family inorganic anion transporter n=1 Tax=Kitasatospora cineracea TaxID=88074 RepID=UPI00378F83B5
MAGFNPVAGLFSGVVPAIVGSLAARTVLMVTTLTSAIALTSQSVLADAGLDPKDAGNVAVLGVLSGAVMLLMGVLRLGVVLSFVSNAVMVGFSTGIALQIVVGVLKDATGYAPQGHNKLVQLGDWLVHAGSWELAATLTSAATVAVWALAHAVKRLRTVALLVAMVLVSAGVAVLGTGVELVGSIADVPAALPHFTASDWSATWHLLYCVQASRQAKLAALDRTPDGRWELADVPAELPAGRVTVLAYSGVSLFAELPLIDADWPRAPDGPAVLVLVVRTVPDVPSSSMVKLLRRKQDELGARGGRLIVAGAQPSFVRLAGHTGLAGALGPDGVVPADPVLDAALEEAVARGERWLTGRRTAAG